MAGSFPEFAIENGYVFRILHAANLPALLREGAPCLSSVRAGAAYVPIGNPDLIAKRTTKRVPIEPGGVLADYVPFYFTPRSMMLMNILTGWNVQKQKPDEILIAVTSVRRLVERQVPFVFTNGHAFMIESEWFSDPARLDRIDWGILQRSDFRRTDDDPGRCNRYQAELLVHKHVGVEDLLGLACFNDNTKTAIDGVLAQHGTTSLKVLPKPNWYPR